MSLIKNSIYNIAGFAVPTVIAIPALGLLARQIGTEFFGIFTLAFALIGYASIFDAGVTRAVIREISINRDNYEEQKKVISTASIVVILLGTIAALLIITFASELVTLLKVTESLASQVILSFKILATIIPFFLLNQVWLASLEGLEKFANINIQRIISSSALAVLPPLACMFHPNIVFAILGLVVGRVLSLIITLILCKKIIFDSGIKLSLSTLKRLLSFGGWLTLSNIISPLMVYFDRFIISNMMGASKIAFYSAPAEGVARLINIPYALARALFPKLSYCSSHQERRVLERHSYLLVTITCLPLVIGGTLLSHFVMTVWMGEEYGGEAADILKILLIGFFFNALAQIPYSLLQAQGKSKITALVHIYEIIPYIAMLFFFTHNFGIRGTAIAWSIRTGADLLLLYFISRRK